MVTVLVVVVVVVDSVALVIVDVDGTAITNANQLQTVVEDSGLNQSLKFKIIRGDSQLQLDVRTAQLETSS